MHTATTDLCSACGLSNHQNSQTTSVFLAHRNEPTLWAKGYGILFWSCDMTFFPRIRPITLKDSVHCVSCKECLIFTTDFTGSHSPTENVNVVAHTPQPGPKRLGKSFKSKVLFKVSRQPMPWRWWRWTRGCAGRHVPIDSDAEWQHFLQWRSEQAVGQCKAIWFLQPATWERSVLKRPADEVTTAERKPTREAPTPSPKIISVSDARNEPQKLASCTFLSW